MDLFRWRPFSAEEEKEITDAIARAEERTSGEIRIHVERYCKTDPVLRASNLFHYLKMDETNQRNGVLLYIAMVDHKMALVGDEGIDEHCPERFWESEFEILKSHFQQKQYTKGITIVVEEIGKILAEHFPPAPEEGNQLSNDISYG